MARSLINDRDLIPLFSLPGRRGEIFDVVDYKRKKNLVIYVATHPTVPFLTTLDEAAGRLREKNAVVVVLSSCDPVVMENIHQAHRLTYPFLCDPQKQVISRFVGASDGEMIAALFITNRNGEIFFQTLAKEVNDLPPFEDIIKSLDLLNSQIPE